MISHYLRENRYTYSYKRDKIGIPIHFLVFPHVGPLLQNKNKKIDQCFSLDAWNIAVRLLQFMTKYLIIPGGGGDVPTKL